MSLSSDSEHLSDGDDPTPARSARGRLSDSRRAQLWAEQHPDEAADDPASPAPAAPAPAKLAQMGRALDTLRSELKLAMADRETLTHELDQLRGDVQLDERHRLLAQRYFLAERARARMASRRAVLARAFFRLAAHGSDRHGGAAEAAISAAAEAAARHHAEASAAQQQARALAARALAGRATRARLAAPFAQWGRATAARRVQHAAGAERLRAVVAHRWGARRQRALRQWQRVAQRHAAARGAAHRVRAVLLRWRAARLGAAWGAWAGAAAGEAAVERQRALTAEAAAETDAARLELEGERARHVAVASSVATLTTELTSSQQALVAATEARAASQVQAETAKRRLERAVSAQRQTAGALERATARGEAARLSLGVLMLERAVNAFVLSRTRWMPGAGSAAVVRDPARSPVRRAWLRWQTFAADHRRAASFAGGADSGSDAEDVPASFQLQRELIGSLRSEVQALETRLQEATDKLSARARTTELLTKQLVRQENYSKDLLTGRRGLEEEVDTLKGLLIDSVDMSVTSTQNEGAADEAEQWRDETFSSVAVAAAGLLDERLVALFRQYSGGEADTAVRPSASSTMSSQQFWRFVDDVGLVDARFSREEVAAVLDASALPGRDVRLSAHDFVTLLVDLAQLKYHQIERPADALRQLLVRHVLPGRTRALRFKRHLPVDDSGGLLDALEMETAEVEDSLLEGAFGDSPAPYSLASARGEDSPSPPPPPGPAASAGDPEPDFEPAELARPAVAQLLHSVEAQLWALHERFACVPLRQSLTTTHTQLLLLDLDSFRRLAAALGLTNVLSHDAIGRAFTGCAVASGVSPSEAADARLDYGAFVETLARCAAQLFRGRPWTTREQLHTFFSQFGVSNDLRPPVYLGGDVEAGMWGLYERYATHGDRKQAASVMSPRAFAKLARDCSLANNVLMRAKVDIVVTNVMAGRPAPRLDFPDFLAAVAEMARLFKPAMDDQAGAISYLWRTRLVHA